MLGWVRSVSQILRGRGNTLTGHALDARLILAGPSFSINTPMVEQDPSFVAPRLSTRMSMRMSGAKNLKSATSATLARPSGQKIKCAASSSSVVRAALRRQSSRTSAAGDADVSCTALPRTDGASSVTLKPQLAAPPPDPAPPAAPPVPGPVPVPVPVVPVSRVPSPPAPKPPLAPTVSKPLPSLPPPPGHPPPSPPPGPPGVAEAASTSEPPSSLGFLGVVSAATHKTKPFLERPRVGYDDMIQLPDLGSEALMGNLERRFRAETVYTYIGDIVVSVNPFKRTGNSDPVVQERYVRQLMQNESSSMTPPHIYCLIGQCYAKMCGASARSLSVLISGESGAGKTEAMKLCVSHLGAVSATQSAPGTASVATRLMATNPVMEPIGNAKTVRNNNSSRFGKHFDIQFNERGQIIGARTSVYLLEKPRICMHMKGERNYHIFYMLCKADNQTRAFGKLDDWEHYTVLKQPGTVEQVTTWDDEEEFAAMHSALYELGFTVDRHGIDQRGQLYAMISIVMQLGNVEFDDAPSGEGSVVANEEQFLLAASLLQVAEKPPPSALRPPPSCSRLNRSRLNRCCL